MVLRLLVGTVFILAGALKLADPAAFAQTVANYRLISPEWVNLVAIFIPAIELTAGLFLLGGVWLQAAALVVTSLTVMFFFAIVSALFRGLNIECGCFGTVSGRQVGLVSLMMDAILFFLALRLVKSGR